MNKITADTMGSSFERDPELRLPTHPRFVNEVLMIPHGSSGILFEGVDGTQLISGQGARAFLPRFIAALDGTRGLDQLSELFPSVSIAKLTGAIALLYSRGLLEDGIGPQVMVGAGHDNEAQAAFFGRHIDTTRVNANREEALARMANAKVAIVGGKSAKLIQDALAGSGLGSLTILNDPSELMGDVDILVTLFTHNEHEKESTWLNRAWSLDIPILHHAAGASHVEVGPLFVPNASASPECFRRILPDSPTGHADDLAMWAAIAAMNVQNIISRIGRMSLYNSCHVHRRHPGEPPSHEEVPLARMPGSVAAGLGSQSHAPRMDPDHLVWRLHNAANGMPPREFLSPRDYQMHYSATNMKSTAERPDPYFGAPVIQLPDGLNTINPTGGALNIIGLAGLLQFTAGHDGKRRITPSAGGLGCLNLYTVVRKVDGLPDNSAWHYDAPAHQLSHLGSISDESLCAMLGITADRLPAAVFFGIASTDKIQKKYNTFAFRFAHLDAGVARAYLVNLTAEMGLKFQEYAAVRDFSVTEALGVATLGVPNIVCFAAGIGMQPGHLRRGYPELRRFQEVTQLAELAAQLPHAAPQPAQIASPAILSPGKIMLARQSARNFSDDSIDIATTEALMRVGRHVDTAICESGALPVRTSVWAAIPDCPSGNEGGIWLMESGGLQRKRRGLSGDVLGRGMLQQSLARAPLVILISGAFHDAVDQWGARGYRELIGRAGAQAAAILLAGTEKGIVGCPWGGISESAWGPLLDIDRYSDCPLFGLSLGWSEAKSRDSNMQNIPHEEMGGEIRD